MKKKSKKYYSDGEVVKNLTTENEATVKIYANFSDCDCTIIFDGTEVKNIAINMN